MKKTLHNGINRRTFLKASALGLGAASLPGLSMSPVFAQEELTLVLSMRSLANPYHATFAQARRAFREKRWPAL